MKPGKKLNLFDFTMIVVSLVIGMGIFRTPVNVAKAVDTPLIFFGVWLAGGLVALCGALTCAEIGSRLPVTGGYYKIFSYAYHPSIAFAVNCVILVSNAASVSAVALVGGEYITGIFIPQSKDLLWLKNETNVQHLQTVQIVIALSAIIIFYGINLLGLKLSARTQNILTIIKITMILLLVTPLFFAGAAVPMVSAVSSKATPLISEYIKAFGIGLVAVSFTYGGYQQTINFGAEINEPKRNIPRGIFFGIFIIIALYLTINYAYVRVIGFEQLKNSKNIAAIMAGKIFGVRAEQVLSVLLFLSVLAYVNVLLMSNPRVMAAMSDDKILPSSFNKRNTKTAVLTISLTVFASICVLTLFWVKEFDKILTFTIFLDCFGMVLSAASIFILRKRTAHLNNSGLYMMKLYPLLPLIFITAYTFVAISITLDYQNNGYAALKGLCVMAGFIIMYFLVKGFKKQEVIQPGI